jgi:hypothetical protein
MRCVVWQIYNVININGPLTCGVKICSAKKTKWFFFFFWKLFLKYVSVVVQKFVFTLAALFKCQPDAKFHYNVFLFFFFSFYLSLWIVGVLKHFSLKVFVCSQLKDKIV